MTKQTRHQPREKVCNNSHLTLTTMARLQGISGGMSGRTGSFTYRQSRGETIVSQYQPLVKNPNTQGQQAQRAKFKLMSQLSAIMSPGFGTMGVTKRPAKQRPTQRNAFVQLNMPLVEVSNDNDNKEVTAKIPMEKLQLTSSFRALPALSLRQEGTGEAVKNIIVDCNDVPTDISIIRLILVGYENGQASIKGMMDAPVEGGSISESFNVPSSAANYTVLGFGLIPSESASKKIDLNNIHTPADENFISAVDLNLLVQEGSLSETKTVGANISVTV